MKRMIVWVAALMVVALPAAARAHGGGVPQVTAAPAGGYLLYVWTEPEAPRAGDTLHVTVAVTLPMEDGSETPVTDAVVQVHLDPGGEGATIDLDAEPGAAAGGVYYEADTVLSQGGDWQVQVSVNGAEGAGEAQFALAVVEAPGLPWGVIGAGAAVLAAAAALAFKWTRRQAARAAAAQA